MAKWRQWVMGVSLFSSILGINHEVFAYTPHGWLWNNVTPTPVQKTKKDEINFNTLSAGDQVAVLRVYTLEGIPLKIPHGIPLFNHLR